ncbi:MAG: hypothetical protein ACJAZ1_003401 [Yoonia sp.]
MGIVAKQPAKGRKTPTKSDKAADKAAKAPESTAMAAPVVDEISSEVRTKSTSTPPMPEKATPAAKYSKEKPKPDGIAEKPTPKPLAAVEKPEPKAMPATPKTAPTPAPVQKSSFLPLTLGGLVAGVIGFAVATFTAPQADNTLASELAAQSSIIDGLEQRVANLPAPDLSGVEAAFANLTARLEALEARPATVAAPSGDMSAVNADMEALRAQIAEMTNAAQAELSDARATANAIEENASAAARRAAGRAALSRIQTALESGAPIGAALGDLENATGNAAPEALIASQDGVTTLASLQEKFPEAARVALATARSEGVAGEESTGLGAFLRNQFDVRSTSPREGTDADAVLSRAEAAVRTGRLSDALAEISALPEVSRAAMSDWLTQSEARASAVAAADILSSTLTDN